MPDLWIPWFERSFDLNRPVFTYPLLVERLRGTPARLEERLRMIPDEVRVRKVDAGWSIQEHAGHLLDLEELWYGRIDDVLSGWDVMRPADLTNRKTHEAAHNEVPVEEILSRFRDQRGRLVGRLSGLDSDQVLQGCLHPRLKKPMRILDLAYFTAEHDDHHLAMITRLLEL